MSKVMAIAVAGIWGSLAIYSGAGEPSWLAKGALSRVPQEAAAPTKMHARLQTIAASENPGDRNE